jgi:SNF2 family DNA or RNA helicase
VTSILGDDSPLTDFQANAEVVRTVVESERLPYGYLYNPAFATEIAKIDPLPHQRIAVYDHLLQQSRLRFLLADDAGAGKTIMSGLYIREMLSRRLISRVLIVAPAGLVGNWRQELQKLFDLPFRIITGSDTKNGNPFHAEESDLLIISVDTLAGERTFARLQEAEVIPYDLVIFDEAHKLSADREADLSLRRTDRYRVAEALAGVSTEEKRWSLTWNCQHLLLLTATPHMGKEYPYYCLWRLLEPEVLSTLDAFNAYPQDARRRHFIRRTKEEMVTFTGAPIYPPRISNTLSYELTRGDESEQQLYDATTRYISTTYNRAQMLNRTAAQLAMSVFQRRLASSTYALLRSFERRKEKLEQLIEDMRAGRISVTRLAELQRRLERVKDTLDESTADEEAEVDGQEEHEVNETELLGGVIARSLPDLEAELAEVDTLLKLARRVFARGEESKFEKLRELLLDPRFQQEKMLIFTEHRDTLEFLIKRLQGMGFTGEIAQIHGGMNYQEREEQMVAFRRPINEGGARYFVATDAAAEGINLQVCWLMVNYDLPWNPARLEQRMGRIHRYGQKHAEVYITNMVAGKTREGRVMKTLLEKLEKIRKDLRSDKVFDVIGQLFEGISLRDYMEKIIAKGDESDALRQIEGRLTEEQVSTLVTKERTLYGAGDDVRSALPRLQATLEQETYRRLLPGYTRYFLERVAPLLDIKLSGDLAGIFTAYPKKPGAMDWLLPLLETYPPALRSRFTVQVPRDGEQAIFLHPGERIFDRLRAQITAQFGATALRGAIFIDPSSERPYFYHLVQVQVIRQADHSFPPLRKADMLECRLVGLRQNEDGSITDCPLEQLLLLSNGEHLPAAAISFAASFAYRKAEAEAHAQGQLAERMVTVHRERLLASLSERELFIEHGYSYQRAELADRRQKFMEKVQAGRRHDPGELTRIKNQQRSLQMRQIAALAVLRREPELIVPSKVTFLAHAIVVPTSDPEVRQRYDADIEAIAVRVARIYEEVRGAQVRDVSNSQLSQAAGLDAWPGFDLLSRLPSGEEIGIEVKGRAGIGPVELTENEYIRACNLRERYWLYVVYECVKAAPRLWRIQDPFGKLIVRSQNNVVIGEGQIFASAEE